MESRGRNRNKGIVKTPIIRITKGVRKISNVGIAEIWVTFRLIAEHLKPTVMARLM